MCDQGFSDNRLPSGWAKNAKSAVLHVISVAQFALTYTRGWADNALNPRTRKPPRWIAWRTTTRAGSTCPPSC